MSGGSSSPQQTTTTQISPQAQELFNLAYPGVKSFAATTPSRYPGSTVVGFNPTQTGAQQDILGGAGAAGDVANWSTAGAQGLSGTLAGGVTGKPYTGAPLATSSDIFSDPGIWNPNYNTGVSDAIAAAQRPTWQALTETALPAIRGGAITAGGYGGSREGIAEGLATGRATQTAQDAANKIVEDLYGANLGAVGQRYATNLGAQNARYATDVGAATTTQGQDISGLLAAYGLAPSLQQQALVPGYTAANVGDVQQQQAQAELNAQIGAYYAQQYAPFLQSQDILSLLGNIPGATTVSTGSTPQPGVGTLATGVLGGAASGAALGSVFPGVGTAVGAGIGGLAGTLPFLFPNR